jgi:HTH-type transcriptional regulator / antitoxin HipB
MQIRTARDLGATIRQARKDRGLSQTGLAKKVGVHQPKISTVEKGAPGVRVGLILQILRTLNLTIAIGSPPKRTTKRRRQDQEKDYVDLDAIADTGLRR